MKNPFKVHSLYFLFAIVVLTFFGLASVKAVQNYSYGSAGTFPASFSYKASVKSSQANAMAVYAPPLSVTPHPSDLTMSPTIFASPIFALGQSKRAIYFGMGDFPGPAGKWDLTDPLHPASPIIIPVTHGTQDDTGPMKDDCWAHNVHFLGEAVAEAPSGEARMTYDFGMMGCSGLPGIASFIFSPGSGDIAQAFDISSYTNGDFYSAGQVTKSEAGFERDIMAMVYTSAGKFFTYGGSWDKGSVHVSDLTDVPSQSASPDSPGLKSSGSFAWGKVSELSTLTMPDGKTYLLGRSSGSSLGSAGGTDNNPIFRAGEINPATGLLSRQKSTTLTLSTKNLGEGGVSFQPFAVGGSAYIMMIEDYGIKSSGQPVDADATLALYKLDLSTLAPSRVATITVKHAARQPLYAYQVATTADQSGNPMLLVPTIQNGFSIIGDDNGELRGYALQSAIQGPAGANITLDSPDLSIPKAAQTFPMKAGDILIRQWPFKAFLKKSGTGMNLYVYRPAFLYSGLKETGIMSGYQVASDSIPVRSLSDLITARFTGTLRVDQIDVSSLYGGGTTSPSGNTPTGGGACTATISFDQTSVPFGGAVTETWKVDGADVGATYADCGAGELQISAGPLSKTLTNMNQSLSCRIYGKINGAEACSATASVNVLPPTTGGGNGGSGGDHFQANSAILPSDNSSGSSDYGNTTLRQGSVGNAVANLQKYLNQNNGAGLAEDGHFGPKTRDAVVSWQTEHGLTADGLVGPQTKAALANAL